MVSMARSSFRQQVGHIMKSACMRAFGQAPDCRPELLPPGSRKQLINYKVSIARDLYEEHRAQDFRFSDHGATPKGLAEEIQVHLTQREGLQWEIDHFGNFIINPTQTYLNNLPSSQFRFHPLPEYEPPAQTSVHYFDFYVDGETTVGDLMRQRIMESRARVLTKYNKVAVHRRMFTTTRTAKDEQMARRICSLLFGSELESIGQFQDLRRGAGTKNEVRYFSSCPSNKVYFENALPHHQLLAPSLGKQNSSLASSLTNDSLRVLLNRQSDTQALKVNNSKPGLIKQLWKDSNTGEKFLLFSDLLDHHQLQEIPPLLAGDQASGMKPLREAFESVWKV